MLLVDMKKIALIFTFIMLLPCLSGCGNKILPEERPEDFSFSLIWGVYGTSSYNSRTGKLVKTTDATHPEDYVTYMHLSDEARINAPATTENNWSWILPKRYKRKSLIERIRKFSEESSRQRNE